MNSSQDTQFHSPEELSAIQALEGKVLSSVHYTLWKNHAKENEHFEALDWLELGFEEGSVAAFTAGEETDGIRLAEFDFKMESLKVSSQFGDQVRLEKIDMSESPLWKETIGKKLKWVGVPKDEETGLYTKDGMRLDFGDKVAVEVSLGIEGLAVVVPDF